MPAIFVLAKWKFSVQSKWKYSGMCFSSQFVYVLWVTENDVWKEPSIKWYILVLKRFNSWIDMPDSKSR